MATYTTDTNLDTELYPQTRLWTGGLPIITVDTVGAFSGGGGTALITFDNPEVDGTDITLAVGDLEGYHFIFNGVYYCIPTNATTTAFSISPDVGTIPDNTTLTLVPPISIEDLQVTGGSTITAHDMILTINRLGAHNTNGGAVVNNTTFADTTISFNNEDGGNAGTRTGGSTNYGHNWSNVTVLGNGNDTYCYFGNDTNRTNLPTYTFNNVNLWGNTNSNAAAWSLIATAMTTTSSFNNLSLWNGEAHDSTDLRGFIVQLDSGIIYNGVLQGPLTSPFNTRQDAQLILRFSAQRIALTATNHTGAITNYDFRQISELAGSNSNHYFIDLDGDNGANMTFINWLPGSPTNTIFTGNRTNFGSVFGSPGRGSVLIGTNPVLGDGEHQITFNRTDADRTISTVNGRTGTVDISVASGGVYLPTTEAWNTARNTFTDAFEGFEATPAAGQGLVVSGTDVANGIYFQNQYYAPTAVSGNLPNLGNTAVEIDDLSSKSYRKYSWTQQPIESEFGKLVTVSVPANGASDADVQTARDGGYDIYNGTTWETSTDVSDSVDAITSQTAIDTIAKATALLDTTEGINQSSYLVAAAKLATWNSITAANIAAANNKVNLDYDYDAANSSVTFDGSISLNSTATGITKTGTAYTFPVNDVIADNLISTITCAGLSISGDNLGGAFAKPSFLISGAGTADISGDLRNSEIGRATSGTGTATLSADVNNVGFNIPTTIQSGTVAINNCSFFQGLSGIKTTDTLGLINLTGTQTLTFSGLTGGQTYNLEDLIGNDYNVESGTITLAATGTTGTGNPTIVTRDTSFAAASSVDVEEPGLEITVDNPESGLTGFGTIYWSLYNGTTRLSEGNISASTGTINIDRTTIGSLTLTLALTGRGYVDARHSLTYADGIDGTGGLRIEMSSDPLYFHSVDISSLAGVSVSSGNNSDATQFTIDIEAGTSSLATRSNQNAIIGAQKSNEFYSRFHNVTGESITFDTSGNTVYYADGTSDTHLMIVRTGSSLSNVRIQGAQWNNGTDIQLYQTSTDVSFRGDVVIPLTVSSTDGTLSATITTAPELDSAIDLGGFGVTVEGALGNYGTATTSNQQAIGRKIDLGTVKSASYSVTIPDGDE